MPQVELRFIWSFLPDVSEGWEEFTLIIEAFFEKLFDAVNISVKIPVKIENCTNKKSGKSTAMRSIYPTWFYLKIISICDLKPKG